MYQGAFTYDLDAVMPEAIKTGLFVSLCTIQAPSGIFNASGAPDGNYVDVAGLVDIPCTAPPPSEIRIQSTELKGLAEIMAAQLKHVLLNGYYPTLEAGIRSGWQAVIDGTVYDALGAESDSQGTQTRMEVKLATI